jgi:hypothetical protein
MKARTQQVSLDRSCPDADLAFGQRRSEMPKKKTTTRKVRKVRCTAKTATGKQCKRYAVGKSKRCPSHR